MKERVINFLKDQNRMLDMAMLFCIAVFAFYVNRDIEIKGLYMDDLYMWSCYGEQSFMEFVFPVGTSTRFRPVYWLFTYLQMAIIGNHVDWFVAFNIICNIIVAYELFYICRRLSGSRLLPFLSALCYLASRFAYYQIGQALGLMETLAQFFALWIFYLLYVYMNRPNDRTRAELIAEGEAVLVQTGQKPELSLRLVRSSDIYFAGALALYVLLCFTHERYLCLLPLFYMVLAVKWLREQRAWRKAWFMENRGKWLAPLLSFLIIMAIRLLSTGALVPAGTGGTEVTDTFSAAQTLSFVMDEIAYIFGINAGDNYLSALSWTETPELIKALVKSSVLCIGVIAALYVIVLLLESSERKKDEEKDGGDIFWRHVADSLLMLMFMGLCIGASSVTIRVEMRWVYVSYSMALIFACYMISAIGSAYRSSFAVDDARAADKGPAGKAAPGVLEGNIFRRMSLTVADRLVGPKVFYGIICLVFLAYCGLSIYTNVFYRGYFPNIYFWQDQQRMNSLAEETVEKYGVEGVLGKQVYILENTYGMSDFYGDTFFKVYDKEKTGQGTVIHFIDDMEDVPEDELRGDGALVLMEVPEENGYRDVTEEAYSYIR